MFCPMIGHKVNNLNIRVTTICTQINIRINFILSFN